MSCLSCYVSRWSSCHAGFSAELMRSTKWLLGANTKGFPAAFADHLTVTATSQLLFVRRVLFLWQQANRGVNPPRHRLDMAKWDAELMTVTFLCSITLGAR
jgi:hypothetical protein